jgi:hypothetical protein
MLNPSSHKCRIRVCVGPGSRACGLGSGITWEGVSSPPRVWPEPRKREDDAEDEDSPPPGLAFLFSVSVCFMFVDLELTL